MILEYFSATNKNDRCHYSNVDGPRHYHTKWSKPDKEMQITWYHLYVECEKKIIWNSSAGIPSSPLSLFIVMLPKAPWLNTPGCLALGVSTPSWLSGSLRFFLHSSSIYSCHLFLISSASVRSLPFLSFIVPSFARNIPLVFLISLKINLFL